MSEAQFLGRLRESTERFLGALDAGEAQSRKYYRMASVNRDSVSADIEPLHREYLEARRTGLFARCLADLEAASSAATGRINPGPVTLVMPKTIPQRPLGILQRLYNYFF